MSLKHDPQEDDPGKKAFIIPDKVLIALYTGLSFVK